MFVVGVRLLLTTTYYYLMWIVEILTLSNMLVWWVAYQNKFKFA